MTPSIPRPDPRSWNYSSRPLVVYERLAWAFIGASRPYVQRRPDPTSRARLPRQPRKSSVAVREQAYRGERAQLHARSRPQPAALPRWQELARSITRAWLALRPRRILLEPFAGGASVSLPPSLRASPATRSWSTSMTGSPPSGRSSSVVTRTDS